MLRSFFTFFRNTSKFVLAGAPLILLDPPETKPVNTKNFNPKIKDRWFHKKQYREGEENFKLIDHKAILSKDSNLDPKNIFISTIGKFHITDFNGKYYWKFKIPLLYRGTLGLLKSDEYYHMLGLYTIGFNMGPQPVSFGGQNIYPAVFKEDKFPAVEKDIIVEMTLDFGINIVEFKMNGKEIVTYELDKKDMSSHVYYCIRALIMGYGTVQILDFREL